MHAFRREIDNILHYYNGSRATTGISYTFACLLKNDTAPMTNRNPAVSATRQVLMTLRFLALDKPRKAELFVESL